MDQADLIVVDEHMCSLDAAVDKSTIGAACIMQRVTQVIALDAGLVAVIQGCGRTTTWHIGERPIVQMSVSRTMLAGCTSSRSEMRRLYCGRSSLLLLICTILLLAIVVRQTDNHIEALGVLWQAVKADGYILPLGTVYQTDDSCEEECGVYINPMDYY